MRFWQESHLSLSAEVLYINQKSKWLTPLWMLISLLRFKINRTVEVVWHPTVTPKSWNLVYLSQGKLIVENKIDGMEHIFTLKGIGKRPVALEHIVANCKVGVQEDRTIMVPNYEKDMVIYKVRFFLVGVFWVIWKFKSFTYI